MFRDDAQVLSFRKNQERLNDKLVKGKLQFSGSCQDLSPKKGKISTLNRMLAKSEINLKEMNDKDLGKSVSLLNILGRPFGRKNETSDGTWTERIGKFWKKRSSGDKGMENRR